MKSVLLVGLGGFAGAVARYGLSTLVQQRLGGAFPAGTLTVNAIGCLAAGALLCLAEERGALSPVTSSLVLVGLLGGFTTFSALGFETLALLRAGAMGLALASVAANVLLGLGAAWAGHALMRLALA